MTEVRLIDANALKKEIHELAIPIYGKMVLKAIDNAPTVEFSKEICSACGRYIREKEGGNGQ